MGRVPLLAFRDGDDVDLRSRNQRPFARYFPEVVGALRAVLDGELVVLDGELVVLGGSSSFDFTALLARLHPAASRVVRLSRETPASYIAFDVLAVGSEDLRACPFSERRARLEALLRDTPVAVTPSTRSRDVAGAWIDAAHGGGIDGVVAKRADLRDDAGRRAMTKVKRSRAEPARPAQGRGRPLDAGSGARLGARPPGARVRALTQLVHASLVRLHARRTTHGR